MSDDPLESWWCHTASVRRLIGAGAGGNVYDPAPPAAPADLAGFYRDAAKLVRSSAGEDTMSAGQFAFPRTADPVPAGSLFIAPAEFGARVFTVIASSIADGGGHPTPDHQMIAVQ